jgi:hypothetical protein
MPKLIRGVGKPTSDEYRMTCRHRSEGGTEPAFLV